MLKAHYYTNLVEAGCDEAGRGCLAGSVYAAAVVLPQDYDNQRLNDSKQLSEKQRKALAEEIKRDAMAWAIGIVTAEEIDKINILNASILAMHRALDQIECQAVIVDGNRFKKYKDLPHTTIVKGDGKYQSIAAASILAKTARDEYMEQLAEEYPQYDWKSNKGYPTKAHREAIREHGITPYHRKSYQLLPEPSLFDNLLPTLILLFTLHFSLFTSPAQAQTQVGERHADKKGVELIKKLNTLRNEYTAEMTNNGYYKFNKELVEFVVDTIAGSDYVEWFMNIYGEQKQYRIRNVEFTGYNGDVALRKKTLLRSTAIKPNDLYSAAALQKTYNNFANLQAVRYTNIKYTELPDTTLLDCTIQLSTAKPSSIALQPEATNTAGDLGAALSLTFDNNNLFHGSEQLSIQGRVAYESITGLEGYTDQDYQEYSLEAKLRFPFFVFPLTRAAQEVTNDWRPQTELTASFDMQNRPEFYRRVVTGSWRYRWTSPSKQRTYRWDWLELNYVYMPWISDTFREDYLESAENRNAILLYNYEDLFIAKMGFSMTIAKKEYTLRTSVESSGNTLTALSKLGGFGKNSNGQRTLFNIAYAQYIKGDLEYTKNINFSDKNQLALHGAFGIAYPYGNSNILPFEKRYFAGGANSVRGWTVRSLGPGRYQSADGSIDFINQTGDMRLDLNAELRFWMFWKFYGAAFLDAGNIWTLRDYDDQAGGQFRFDTFYEEIAVAYGLGLRLNLGYFILRFDFGMKAINPSYTSQKEHWAIIHPNIGRDLAVHFAVGLPF